jgi:hypothetical protein
VKHATETALDRIEPLLREVRRIPGLVERKRGIWYRESSGFLHFHEDPAGLFADLKIAGDFERFRVSTGAEQRAFLRRLRATLAS